MMDIVQRSATLEPWGEADGIPWNDPEFSARMLREHLSQTHHQASRRAEKIDAHTAWIHRKLLGEHAARILDLGCGPGLYAERLAQLGHSVVGIDFSPASIAWARERARETRSACTYEEADLRSADFGSGFGFAMLIFGELNVFRRQDARSILSRVHAALEPEGTLLLEVHLLAAVEHVGRARPRWSSAPQGLFGDQPYLRFEESQYHPESATAVTRYFVVDAETAAVRRYGGTLQGYSDDAYRELLTECGFGEIEARPSLTGEPDPEMPDLCVLLAKA